MWCYSLWDCVDFVHTVNIPAFQPQCFWLIFEKSHKWNETRQNIIHIITISYILFLWYGGQTWTDNTNNYQHTSFENEDNFPLIWQIKVFHLKKGELSQLHDERLGDVAEERIMSQHSKCYRLLFKGIITITK